MNATVEIDSEKLTGEQTSRIIAAVLEIIPGCTIKGAYHAIEIELPKVAQGGVTGPPAAVTITGDFEPRRKLKDSPQA